MLPGELPFTSTPISALRVLLGLLITLLLHGIQLVPLILILLLHSIQLLPAMLARSEKAPLVILFFGFTQLFYMIPVILHYKRSNDRSLMIGLIIGATLTFILGLPFAGLGYGLAKRSMNASL